MRAASPGHRVHVVRNGIDLERFPVGVTDRVPQVEGYRYIVVEDDVVIVDPQDRLVALVITG
jgi:hypothetical protein